MNKKLQDEFRAQSLTEPNSKRDIVFILIIIACAAILACFYPDDAGAATLEITVAKQTDKPTYADTFRVLPQANLRDSGEDLTASDVGRNLARKPNNCGACIDATHDFLKLRF